MCGQSEEEVREEVGILGDWTTKGGRKELGMVGRFAWGGMARHQEKEEEEEDVGCGCRSAGETRLSALRGEDSRFLFGEEDTGSRPQEKKGGGEARRADGQGDDGME